MHLDTLFWWWLYNTINFYLMPFWDAYNCNFLLIYSSSLSEQNTYIIILYWIYIPLVYLSSSTFTWLLFLRNTPIMIYNISFVNNNPYLEPSYLIKVIGLTRSIYILFSGSKLLIARFFGICFACLVSQYILQKNFNILLGISIFVDIEINFIILLIFKWSRQQ